MSKKPMVRHAVAVMIRGDAGLVLAVKRPDEPGEELPGIWGLPATTLRSGESTEEGVHRIGWAKLGVDLAPGCAIGSGEQQRSGYLLRMTLYKASMRGNPSLPATSHGSETRYAAIDWLPLRAFGDAAARGSLCCRLFLGAQAEDR